MPETTGYQFQAGDRVRLTSSTYGDYPSNPIYGGRHGCDVGTVREVGDDIRVVWDNGTMNTYCDWDLVLEGALPGAMQDTVTDTADTPSLTVTRRAALIRRACSAEFTQPYTFENRHTASQRDARLMLLIRDMKRELERSETR